MIGHQAPGDDTTSMLTAILKLAERGDDYFRSGQSNLEWEQYGELVLDYLGLSEDDGLDLLEDMKDFLLKAAF